MPLPLSNGRGIHILYSNLLELEPHTKSQQSWIQNLIQSVCRGAGSKRNAAVNVTVHSPPAFLVSPVLEFGIEDVEEICHQVDPASISKSYDFLQSHIEPEESVQAIRAKRLDVRCVAPASGVGKGIIHISHCFLDDPAFSGQKREGDVEIIGKLVESSSLDEPS